MSNPSPEEIKKMKELREAMDSAPDLSGNTKQPEVKTTVDENIPTHGVSGREWKISPDEAFDAMMGTASKMQGNPTTNVNSHPSGSEISSDPMYDILNKFEDTTRTLMEDASDQDREYYTTSKTEKGVQIGEWEIQAHKNEKGKNTKYSIIHVQTGNPILGDIRIFESARFIVRKLNSGSYINDSTIAKVLYLEKNYESKLFEAVSLKANLRKNLNEGNSHRANILEDKLDVAKAKLSKIKKEIKSLV